MSRFDGSAAPHGWQPRTWLTQLFALREEQVEAALGDGYFLVVRLDQFSSTLAEGLKAAEANARPILAKPKLAAGTLMGVELIHQVLPVTPPAQESSAQRSAGRLEALLDLRVAECHVISVRKRSLASHTRAVAVGRTLDNDIPLQHPSVSKFHATLECSDRFYVTDLGSTNRTSLNGASIRARREVLSGDTIKFGAVHCVATTAADLWCAMHAPRGS
jgi:hypothetical protein